jgi:hypothetical protein
VTKDGALSMTGKKTGFMGRIRWGMDKQNLKFYVELHCIFHQQSLCGKTFEVSTCYKSYGVGCELHSIHGLSHQQFQSFLMEIYAEYGDILYHTVMGQCWNIFLVLNRNFYE